MNPSRSTNAPAARPDAGLHVAIIMDGNGRWASQRGLPRVAGHRAGADTVRRVVEAAPDLGIGTLTLYAFSRDNWSRPPREVAALMKLLSRYLAGETARLVANGVRLEAIGRRDRLPAPVVALLEDSERATREGRRLRLRLALDYSSRFAILEAARVMRTSPAWSPERFSALLGPDVDLLIRTSGEQRLSDFLLWECAYAEMVFTPRKWPDFSCEDLAAAVAEFHRRERRFGGLTAASALRTA
ncbi:MAG TPA: di-trans,poly-cis-decaprenylcistransferase [Bryobacteraceae bacterium]|nr:di-trans,poly-cis-decaprenylcistransferase [Bryobacteraceae bacterium]